MICGKKEGHSQKTRAPRHRPDPEPPNCLHLAAMGRCFSDNSTSLDRIWSTCPAACGVCPKPASPSLYRNNNGALADHHDMDLDCEARAARGHCWHEDYRKTMHQHCTRACVKHETWQGCMRSQIMLNKLHSRKPGTRYSPDIPCERAAECRAQCFAQMIIADANKATSRLEAIPWKDLVGEDDAGSQQALEPNDGYSRKPWRLHIQGASRRRPKLHCSRRSASRFRRRLCRDVVGSGRTDRRSIFLCLGNAAEHP